MKPTLFNEPRAMTDVPSKGVVYVLGSTNPERVTLDGNLFFQRARIWPYKAMDATTGLPTANAATLKAGLSNVKLSGTLTSLIVSGGIALATSANHGLRTGQYVTIAGATPSECNGKFVIFEATTDTFKFQTATAAAGPATGTITFTKPVFLPYSIATSVTTPLEIILPLGMKRSLTDIVISGSATDGAYVEWD